MSRRVLIAELYGMGDMISLEPLVAALQREGWEVKVLGQDRWKPILPGVTWIGAPASWQAIGPAGFVKFALNMVRKDKEGFRGVVGIDPRGDIRSILFLHLLGCKQVLTLDHYLGTSLRLPSGIAKRAVQDSTKMMRWQLALQFLNAFGIQPIKNRPPQAVQLRGNIKKESMRVGLVPVAPWAGKLWPQERWREVVLYLLQGGFQPILICGPGDEEAARGAAGTPDLEVFMATNVPALAESIAACAAIVTLDSGPMHLASALNVPVVALFGTGQLPTWAPFSSTVRIVTSPHFWEKAIHPVDENIPIAIHAMSQIQSESVILAFEEVYREAYAQDLAAMPKLVRRN
jgi:ADP-heptose:LPS heptosyltransferase